MQDHLTTLDVAADAKDTRAEFKRLDNEIAELRRLLWKAITTGSGWSDADLERARELTKSV